MKTYMITFLCLAFAFSALASSLEKGREEKIALLNRLLQHYAPPGSISLELKPTNMVQAYVSQSGPVPQIVVYEGVINQFAAPEVLFIVCHELGHLLAPGRRSFEGEADYFAGSCVHEFFPDESEEIIISTFEKLYQSKVDPRLALETVAESTIEMYPPKECRALSALNGAENRPRPACWFRE